MSGRDFRHVGTMDEASLRDRVRRFDPDRFLCTLFAPPERRRSLWALLAFNLEIARIAERVREPVLGRMRLEWWRQALDGVFSGAPAEHAVARALADAVRDHGLRRAPLDRLLDGRERDFDAEFPADLAALLDYAEATSGTVADAWLDLLGVDDAPSRDAARGIGRAWALVGLARANPFRRAAGLNAIPARIGLRAVAAAARDDLAGLPRPSRRALSAFLPAVLARLYLDRLERAGFEPADPRVAAVGAGRIVRLAWAGFTGRIG